MINIEDYFEENPDGEFLINGKWYIPLFGCDTIQHLIDELNGSNQIQPPTKPPCGKWQKEKPNIPCVFMTKMWNKSLGMFDYKIGRFEKIKDDDGWYLGWLTEDGDEWDDIDRCNFDEYYVIEYFKD